MNPYKDLNMIYPYYCPKLKIIFTIIPQINRPFYVFFKKIASDFLFFKKYF